MLTAFQKMAQKEDLKKLLKTSQKIFLLIFIKCSKNFGTAKAFMVLVTLN